MMQTRAGPASSTGNQIFGVTFGFATHYTAHHASIPATSAVVGSSGSRASCLSGSRRCWAPDHHCPLQRKQQGQSRIGVVTVRTGTGDNSSSSSESPPLNAAIQVKLGLAESTCKLDMSDCELDFVPREVFELTDLEELSLAGNALTNLPPEIGKLTCLRRLQLSGNRLEALPSEIGALTALEGLWLHGNYIKELPSTLGRLTGLTQLSLAGNNLRALPEEISALTGLRDLSAAGNKLEGLPTGLGQLSGLVKLSLHGNCIRELPPSLTGLVSLKELWLQGNPTLAFLPECLGNLPALEHMSVADCALMAVPSTLGKAPSLVTLALYGNKLHSLPKELVDAPHLQYLWTEGNPLLPECCSALVQAAVHRNSKQLKGLGLDEEQAAELSTDLVLAAGDCLKTSTIIPGHGPGYFKLQKARVPPVGLHNGDGTSHRSSVLVVAFGSAPGVVNWVGALNKTRKVAPDPRHNDFDCLYVVDPERSWYGGGDDTYYAYESRLRAITSQYKQVIMIGDSMGATAALLFAHMATNVHAFCPQIDLERSSIRPACGTAWFGVLHQRVIDSLEACRGKITVHSGNWAHDLDQTNVLPPANNVFVQIYSVDSHRLAYRLDADGRLIGIIRGAISQALDLPGAGQLRLSNLY